MTSRQGGHVDRPPLSAFRPSASKLHVERSQSRETITIQFSALGKGEEEDEELYGSGMSDTPSEALANSQGIVTALEASEDLVLEGESETKSVNNVAVLPVETSVLPGIPGEQNTSSQDNVTGTTSVFAGATKGPVPLSGSTHSSPSKSVSLPSMDKAFFNLMKSLSTDVEPREGVPAPSLRHRQLVKSLVKSLSTDTTQDPPGSTRPTDSRLNLPLFKQFTQSRAGSTTLGDSKTAPSSPLTSPDNRSFSFKVSEVEARIEDTRRRFSEVMSDPLQLISKFIGDEASNIYRPKPLLSSASESTSLLTQNGHLESNNNYSIKEEGGDLEDDGTTQGATEQASVAESKTIKPSSSSSLGLDMCSMSALAKQEDEEFCELYSEDFELCADTEEEVDHNEDTKSRSTVCTPASGSVNTFGEAEVDLESAPSIPHKTLFALTVITYGYFVLPLPTYFGGILLGVALGFMLAIGVVWLTGPKRAGITPRHARYRRKPCNMERLDLKEPRLFKGWMNEIYNYDPETYHATLTHSVFVRLDGSTLRISKPNKNVKRRASYNEAKPDVTYISQKIYDLTDSKVSLIPSGLARKRVWNKKYPICIELAKQEDFMSKAEGDQASEEKENSDVSVESRKVSTLSLQDGSRMGLDREPPVVYLFGRTGRDKEEWFRRILCASKLKSETAKKTASPSVGRSNPALSHSRSSSKSSLDELLSSGAAKRESMSAKVKPLLEYSTYMTNYINPPTAGSQTTSPRGSPHSSPGVTKKLPDSPVKEEGTVCWVNALIGRIAWDFLREQHWADWVSRKIQMKLSKIRLPYFMNELTLTELDMGVCTPTILWASQPSVDHQGLWFDLGISYKGSFLMTLETKMNLSRLGKEGEGLGEFGKEGHRPRTYCLADSDEESSSAGSSDEDDGMENVTDKNLPPGAEGYSGVHRPSKIMRFVDKITKSKYFQKAAETEFIKKKMEEVSNTPLLLTVELQECKGTLAVNIPPPPTDRIWYGFRSPPLLELKARPKLGEREVTLAHVTDWIEKKLEQEFQKILVMPNMDDVWLHIMHSATDPRSDTAQTDNKEGANAPSPDVPLSEGLDQ